MLILPATLSIASVEKLFSSINSDTSSTIQLPQRLANGGTPGLQAAIIQLLVTWARAHAHPTLFLSNSQYKNEQLSDEVFRTAYGLNALLLATKVVSSSGATIPRSVIDEYLDNAIDAMDRQKYADTLRGPGALLECVMDGQNEFISPFYELNCAGGLRAKSSFHKISESLIASCNQTLSRRIPKSIIENIGNVLYELIKNTDEHAREDLNGVEAVPNVRGVLVRYAELGDQKIDAASTHGDSSLATYFSLAMLKQGPKRREANVDREKNPFIEISVFDSGPGLAMRWGSIKEGISSLSDVTAEKELSWVAECFDLHKTTKASRESGRGLAEAVNTFVTLGAFVRLRTGRLSLIQNFIRSSSVHTNTFSPSHWDKNAILHPQAEGTCFTIIFPVLPGTI